MYDDELFWVIFWVFCWIWIYYRIFFVVYVFIGVICVCVGVILFCVEFLFGEVVIWNFKVFCCWGGFGERFMINCCYCKECIVMFFVLYFGSWGVD